ncbi:hypothetical protein FJZ41_01420 [Candidatus Shapirobacteria bacterium]|nr:hypothetical protein [Candidatus Shapirobacteria bacterium]
MKDLKHYLLLLAILSIGFGLFWIFNFNRQIQILITIALGIAYVVWGTIHHATRREFHWRLVWEYVVVATIACVIVVFLLLRS